MAAETILMEDELRDRGFIPALALPIIISKANSNQQGKKF
jgi:hypothetical protein